MANNKKTDSDMSANAPQPSEFYCRDIGHGEAVLLLHGFPLNSRVWCPQIAALRARARLLAPDFPGFGLSPPSSNSPSFASYAADVSALLDKLNLDRIAIVALAEGTCVAFHLVEELGAKLQGLVLASPALEPETPEAKSRLESLIAEVLLDGRPDPALDEFLPRLIGPTTQRLRPHLFDEVQSIMRESTPAGIAAGLTSLANRPDYTPFLAKIRCPVLCIAGEEDAFSLPEALPRIAEQIPGALTETFPECGRLCNLESPNRFNDATLSLLAECLPISSGS